jgi:cation/acetate symporter
MAITARTRLVNPRLGSYFGIFTAAFAALVLMSLMLEQLGIDDAAVRLTLFAGPIALYVAIGVGSRARELGDYFACGRRVPAFFNGLVLGVVALGGAGFLAFTGSLLIVGVDAMCLSMGWCAGLVCMGVLFAPFLRKFGAYTLPAFLGRRFESRVVRLLAAILICVPLLLLLTAEARFAGYAAGWMLGQSERALAAACVAAVAFTVLLGGMRSLTWSSVAKCIAAVLALAVGASIIAILVSNLPLPQLTHGNVVRVLTRTEMAKGVPVVLAPALAFDLPGDTLAPLVKRFLQSFGSIGSLSFVLMSFVVTAGVAASPSLLARVGTAPGVYEARKSLGWAVLVAGVILLTLPAVAVYLRTMILDQVANQPADSLPAWFQLLQQAGIAKVEARLPTVRLSDISFERDAALFALPIAAGYPQVLVYLSLAGALAAALAAFAAGLATAANMVAEDLIHGRSTESASDAARVGIARMALLGVAGVVVAVVFITSIDPLQLVIASLNFGAGVTFPLLLLAIWDRRTNSWGALACMAVGFGVTALAMLLGYAGAIGLPGELAGAAGAPAALGAGVLFSRMTPVPGRNALDVLQDMRVPGGETLYDREVRLLRLRGRTPT